jgi:hypothetical protein
MLSWSRTWPEKELLGYFREFKETLFGQLGIEEGAMGQAHPSPDKGPFSDDEFSLLVQVWKPPATH